MPRNSPGKKSVSVTMPMETYESIKSWADEKEWSVAKASFKLIEMGLEQLYKEQKQPQPQSSHLQPTEVKPSSRDTSKPRVMDLAELFALRTLSNLIQENYYKLQENGKISHHRLKKLASGERASQQERQIISQVLGIGIEELPED
jgi:hypothetical protein